LFITQLMNIGKVIEAKSDYQTLIENQKKYFRKYFINVILNPEKDFEKEGPIQLEEYMEKRIYDYGFGITTGSSALFSPSFNIKWDDIKDQELFDKNFEKHSKVLNFEKLFLMVKRKDINIDDKYVSQFIAFIRDTEKAKELRKQIVKELYEEFIKKESSKKERPMRVLFSFKVREDDTEKILYPGEMEGFREWYVALATSTGSAEDKGLCQACNKIKEMAGPFNTGLFTLDQASFSLGFTGKKSNQYRVCKDCYALINRGFNFVEENLNFYAYKFKRGKDDVRVYHYLIPIAMNTSILKESIREIKKVKTQLNLNKKMLVEQQIKVKAEGMRKAAKKQKKILEEIASLEERKKKYEDNTNINFDINELLEQLDSLKLSFLDIFYIITDNKQNPTVKEIIDVILIKRERIQFLVKTIKRVKDEFALNALRFNDLNYLVNNKQFTNILAQFLSGGAISERIFERLAFKSIKQAFKNKYFKNEDSNYFSKKVETYQIMYTLFQESGSIKIGD